MVGSLIGTLPDVLYVGEYFGFYAACSLVPAALARVPSTIREQYLADIKAHAVRFALERTRDAGCSTFCDATPWNLRIAAQLVELLPDSIFILCIRHPIGVTQSLGGSFAAGFRWAGRTVAERAALYDAFYRNVVALPEARTVPFDYDAFCASPDSTLVEFAQQVAALLGKTSVQFDLSVMTRSHAPGPQSRPPLGTVDEAGHVHLVARPSMDAARWSKEQSRVVFPIVQRALHVLRERYPHCIAASGNAAYDAPMPVDVAHGMP